MGQCSLVVVLCFLLLAVVSARVERAQQDVVFGMEFSGTCDVNGTGLCSVQGHSQTVSTWISAFSAEIEFDVQPISSGSFASLKFYLPTLESQGNGTLSFGDALYRHSLTLVTHGRISVIPAYKDSCLYLSGTYLVLNGTGAFAAGYGLVSVTGEYTLAGHITAFAYGRVSVAPPTLIKLVE